MDDKDNEVEAPPLSCASLADLQHLMMTTDSVDANAQMAYQQMAQYRVVGVGASSSGAGGSFYPVYLRGSLDLADVAAAPGVVAAGLAGATGDGDKMQPPIKRLIGRRHTASGSAGDSVGDSGRGGGDGGGGAPLVTSSRDSKISADNNSMLLDFFHPHPPSPSSSHTHSGDNNDPPTGAGEGGYGGGAGGGGATASHSGNNSGDGIAAVGVGTVNLKSGGVTFAPSVTSRGDGAPLRGTAMSSSSRLKGVGDGDGDLDRDRQGSGDCDGSGDLDLQLNMNINSIFSQDQEPHTMGLGTLSCMSIEDGGGMGLGASEYSAAAALLKVSSEDWNEPWRNDPGGGGIQLQLPAGARAAAALMASSSGVGGVGGGVGVAGSHEVLGLLGPGAADGLLGDYDELMQFNFQSASLDILDGAFYGVGQSADGGAAGFPQVSAGGGGGGAGHLLTRFGGMPPFPRGGMGAANTDNLTFEQLQLLQHGRGLGIPSAAGLGGRPRLAMVRRPPAACLLPLHLPLHASHPPTPYTPPRPSAKKPGFRVAIKQPVVKKEGGGARINRIGPGNGPAAGPSPRGTDATHPAASSSSSGGGGGPSSSAGQGQGSAPLLPAPQGKGPISSLPMAMPPMAMAHGRRGAPNTMGGGGGSRGITGGLAGRSMGMGMGTGMGNGMGAYQGAGAGAAAALAAANAAAAAGGTDTLTRRLRPPKKPKGDDGFGSGLNSSNSSEDKAPVPAVSSGFGMSLGGWGNGMAMGMGGMGYGSGMGMDNAVALGADPQMGVGISDTVFHGFRRQQRSGGGGGMSGGTKDDYGMGGGAYGGDGDGGGGDAAAERPGGSRGRYKCGRCGQPKTNHVCEYYEDTSMCSTGTQAARTSVIDLTTLQPFPGERFLVVGSRKADGGGIISNSSSSSNTNANTNSSSIQEAAAQMFAQECAPQATSASAGGGLFDYAQPPEAAAAAAVETAHDDVPGSLDAGAEEEEEEEEDRPLKRPALSSTGADACEGTTRSSSDDSESHGSGNAARSRSRTAAAAAGAGSCTRSTREKGVDEGIDDKNGGGGTGRTRRRG